MTTTSKPHILLVEDSTSTALVYASYLADDYTVTTSHSLADAQNQLLDFEVDGVLLDIRLPDGSGMDLLQQLRRKHADLPVVMMTAHGSVDDAVNCMRFGASDFLTKPFDKARLLVTLNNTMKQHRLMGMVDEYEKVNQRNGFHQMIGRSLAMQNVYRIIESAASSNATVFITGESGTGKELCAQAIHDESPRNQGTLVALNCAAIPKDLMESEIFGHIKGAFTGATQNREGAAKRAHQGTLFLDEIGEMPMELQSKLLRFIQTGQYQPVGSNQEVAVDVRFVCATNRDPLAEVRAGRFREDLYYRLHVIPIQMPPLRDRGDDCLLIANEFLRQYSMEENKGFECFDSQVEQLFRQYGWPGNVRELSNVVRNAVILNQGDRLRLNMLSKELMAAVQSPVLTEPPKETVNHSKEKAEVDQTPGQPRDIQPLWLQEKRIIEAAIDQCQGNVPKAAAFLEISASTIYRKKQQWEKLAGNA